MLTRLQFALLLALAAGAIFLGLYPSLLTPGALLGLPLAALGAVGVAMPGVILRRPLLRRFALAGGGILGLELALLGAWLRGRPGVL